MTALKIGIVEDDLIIAHSISEMLLESGYLVTKPAKRYSEAISMIEEELPDLLLLDITILGRMDGIEIGRTVQKAFGIPFIFLTASTDYETISRAKEVAPAAFLAKPVTKAQLYAAIEIAMSNAAVVASKSSNMKSEDQLETRRPLFVKDGYSYRKVLEEEILFVESEQNYLVLQLSDGSRVTMRATIHEFMENINAKNFLRIHRSYIVAVKMVKGLNSTTLQVEEHTLPIGKAYRDDTFRALGIR